MAKCAIAIDEQFYFLWAQCLLMVFNESNDKIARNHHTFDEVCISGVRKILNRDPLLDCYAQAILSVFSPFLVLFEFCL